MCWKTTAKKEKKGSARPVVLSAKRYEGILSRLRQDDLLERLEAIEEDKRYKQYLKDGNDALCEQFTGMKFEICDAQERQAKKDRALADEVSDRVAERLLDELRKERIMRANDILNNMKPGPRALHKALLESEMAYQRKRNQGINRQIAADAKQQEQVDENMCPAGLVPYNHLTEEQEQAEILKKKQDFRDCFLKDMAERREQQLANKEREKCEAISERQRLILLQELDDKAGRELRQKKREFCQNAYKDALVEKAKRDKYECMRNAIDDRVICVGQASRRTLRSRNYAHIAEIRRKRNCERDARSLAVYRQQQSKISNKKEIEEEERYKDELLVHEVKRECERDKLAAERREYELIERKQEEEKRLRAKDIRRFEMATRLKNMEANRRFSNCQKKRAQDEKDEMRRALRSQQERFLEQRQEELLRIAACEEDPYLNDDVKFFEDALHVMEDSQKLGRPLYPLAQAVEAYKRENQIDMTPEGQSPLRNKQRDCCWPGYFSKADLAYKKYAHRERCRQEQQQERHKIFDSCIKITKMAAEERPFEPCPQQCPYECAHYLRGNPNGLSMYKMDINENIRHPTLESVPGDLPAMVEGQELDLETRALEPIKSKSTILASSRSEATKRKSGGGNPVETASIGLKHSLRKPDLNRCWTARPQVQQKQNVTSAATSSKVPYCSKYTWPEHQKQID